MEELFGLKFIASEFQVDNLRIDTLAFNEETKSFVIIEYKNVKSYSVVDQGYSYLALLLNNKAEFVLKYNLVNETTLSKDEFDFSQTSVMFISPSYTTYQLRSVEFSDIAFEFSSWISVEFRLYLVKEFQRLKAEEQKMLGWTAKRELSKINYRIHTDAIKSHLIPEEVTREQANIIYAEEADVLNVAMFGMTAKQWREANPELKGNIRDYATINELICLSNMENINAVLINDGIPQGERLVKLNQIAIQQMQVLEGNNDRKLLK